MLLKLLIY